MNAMLRIESPGPFQDIEVKPAEINNAIPRIWPFTISFFVRDDIQYMEMEGLNLDKTTEWQCQIDIFDLKKIAKSCERLYR